MSILKHPRTLLVVLLLPLLVAGVGMWALKDRVDRLDQVPAAVVNLDEGTHMTIDGEDTFVPFGRQLAGALTQPQTATAADSPATTGFDWTLTDEADATAGLRDGEYSAVIVIPKGFSADLATLGTPEARQATIEVTTNDASGVLDSAIGIAVSQAAASSTGTEMTRQYLSQLYVGFTTMHESFSRAADGAEGLDQGVTGLDEGIGQTSEGARQLADGADGLASGTRRLSEGVTGLDDGIQQTADGSRTLSDGIGQLATGTDGIADGSRTLSDGLGQLADGADGLADGARQLSDGINGTDQQPGLVQGVDQLDAGITGDGTSQNPGLVAGAQALADGTQGTADGVRLVFEGDGTQGNPGLIAGSTATAEGTQTFVDGLETIRDGSDTTGPGLATTAEGMRTTCELFTEEERAADPRLAGLCGAGSSPGLVDAVEGYSDGLDVALDGGAELVSGTRTLSHGIALAAHGDGSDQSPGLVAGSQQLADGAAQMADQVPALEQGVQQLADGVHQLGDGASQLADGSAQLADGTRQSADGAAQLADGADQLSTGAHGAADGASQLADGTDLLADGSSQLVDGSSQLADGADQLAQGTQGLADGTVQLKDGSSQLKDGSGQLATGLRDGADQVPSYTASQRESMSTMGAQPVTSLASRTNEADGSATATFPFVVALALWLGAFGTFLLLPALSRRFLDAAMPMWMVVARSLLPAVLVGIAQAVTVLGVITAIGVRPVSPLGVGAITLAGALVFAALHQALLAVLGNRVGRIASLVVMVLQVVVLAGILPLQTAPPLLQSISAVLPMTILSQGLVHAALGGALVSMSASLLSLGAWILGSVAVTLIASRRARSMRMAGLVTESDALPA